MSVNYYYQLCQDNIGQDVEITDHHGKKYFGKIEKVDHENVYLRQEPAPSEQTGPGLFFFPLAVGALIAIPLIGIAGFRRRAYY
ncbi:hypothetical protein [Evansella cellulosilytica]|uniref:Uncharacterized protein n=1 Tax=Evansella cellulosilytica (strain ATCC 21833 / DSM 2522 / FERM P-1141 / JCM 9156 / N-4) TaxID=649639 RepID=E6TQI0_EVAC2|nr:hypothetical protein [Evansella cellulosilytica]ADU30491.1 hypothetical protein Bcell_2231 [Evansella cellulosilytica DSM 2522]